MHRCLFPSQRVRFRQCQMVALMLICLGFAAMNSASALDIETLVMPGEVIAAHAKFEAECTACHSPFERARQNVLCVDCHQDVGNDQQLSRGFHGLDEKAKNANCAACHTEHIGRDADIVLLQPRQFNHQYTDFELLDKHAEVECKDCHQPDVRYREAPGTCIACHRDDDTHEGGLGEECASCHAPKGWEFVQFDHAAETSFALTGGHAETECIACHVDQHFVDTPTSCVSCHRADDVHEGSRGDDCGACHTDRNWTESQFDHALATAFPLLGAHAQTTCEQCHVSSTVDVKLETTCFSCHADDDIHAGLLGQDCASCHGERNWQDTRFRHAEATGFALVDSHAELTCEACHTAPVHESNPGTTCFACHAEDDPHAGQLGESCSNCHNESSWQQRIRFDHDFTVFPLIGLHKEAECAACHETARFQDALSTCIDCHREDDVHAGGLGENCGACHNPVGWARWRFDHYLSAGFALDGGHSGLACVDCHRTPTPPGQSTPARCIDCHRQDDIHDGQFGKDCARCHTTTTFRGAQEQ